MGASSSQRMQPRRLGLAKRPQRQPEKFKKTWGPGSRQTFQPRRHGLAKEEEAPKLQQVSAAEGTSACQRLRWRLACLFQRLPPRTLSFCAGGREGVAAAGALGVRCGLAGGLGRGVPGLSRRGGGGGGGRGRAADLGVGSSGAEAWSDPPAASTSATGRSTKSRSTTPVSCTPPKTTNTSRMHSTGKLWRHGGT